MSKQPVFRYAIRAKFRQSENQLMRTDQRSNDGLDTRIRDRRDRFSHSHKCQPFASCQPRRCDKRAASAIRTNVQRASTLTWLQVRGDSSRQDGNYLCATISSGVRLRKPERYCNFLPSEVQIVAYSRRLIRGYLLE